MFLKAKGPAASNIYLKLSVKMNVYVYEIIERMQLRVFAKYLNYLTIQNRIQFKYNI